MYILQILRKKEYIIIEEEDRSYLKMNLKLLRIHYRYKKEREKKLVDLYYSSIAYNFVFTIVDQLEPTLYEDAKCNSIYKDTIKEYISPPKKNEI